MIYTAENIYEESLKDNPVKYSRIIRGEKWKKYKLENDITIQLTDGQIITIQKGFEWDLSSVPKRLWSIIPPDGDFAIAALIHDYLYVNKGKIMDRKSSDKEMLIWSRAINTTKKISFKRIDNYVRYLGVRIAGWWVWDDVNKKIKSLKRS